MTLCCCTDFRFPYDVTGPEQFQVLPLFINPVSYVMVIIMSQEWRYPTFYKIVKLELKLNTKLGLHTTHLTTNFWNGSNGSHQKKNVPISGKSPKGGGASAGDQKVHNSKCGLLDKRGGGHIFIFFPNVNVEFQCFS